MTIFGNFHNHAILPSQSDDWAASQIDVQDGGGVPWAAAHAVWTRRSRIFFVKRLDGSASAALQSLSERPAT